MQLADAQYWNSWWEHHVPFPFPPATERQYGTRGYFLRTMDAQGLIPGQTVVELGGVMSFRLLSLAKWRAMKATAVDYAGSGLQLTARWFAQNGCDLETIEADFYSLPQTRQFDLVTHWGVAEHETAPSPLLALCARLLKPGGLMVFSMPNMRGPGAHLWRRWSPVTWARHIYHSDPTIREAAARAGLDCKSLFHGAPYIYIGPCESTGVFPTLAYQVQRGLERLGRANGWPYAAQHRVFVCRHA